MQDTHILLWFLLIILGIVIIFISVWAWLKYKNLLTQNRYLNDEVTEKTRQLEQQKIAYQELSQSLNETRHCMVELDKMAALGQLAAGIAHEIRNPLNFVVNFAELSSKLVKKLDAEIHTPAEERKELAKQERILEALEQNLYKINSHGKRVDTIIRGMLLQSGGQKGKFQLVDLNNLLQENTTLVFHSMRGQDQSFNTKIETNFDSAIGNVKVIPQNLSRALFNIIHNACYAANEKGKTTDTTIVPLVLVTTKKIEKIIEIRVWDNGYGIPSEEISKIFTPFYTTKPLGEGTGLGLSIAHEIITKEHQGTLAVNSKEGEYAEFIIRIPQE